MIRLHTGPMFSGKSEALLQVAKHCLNGAEEFLAIAAGSDTRIFSRSGPAEVPAVTCRTWKQVLRLVWQTGARVVLLDEVHLLHSCQEEDRSVLLVLRQIVEARGLHFWCAGLLGTTEFEIFPSMAALLPFVGQVVYHKAFCQVCLGEASFAVCKLEKAGPILEGRDLYEPRCERHLAQGNPNMPELSDELFRSLIEERAAG